MNNKAFILIFGLVFFAFACSKEDTASQKLMPKEQGSALRKAVHQNSLKEATDQGFFFNKGTKIKGVGFYAETNECDYVSKGASYALRMTGDLEGCLYAFIETSNCWGNGLYYETGREIFVGTYKGKSGSFRTTYKFEAKFEGCANGAPSGAEIFGICQHPIVEGSGEGAFAGVTGRLDFWDNVKATPINFPYIGYLKF